MFCPKQSGMLFDEGSYSRFQKHLTKIVLEQHPDEIKRMGINPKDIGVHSIRKGAATYCCCGTTSVPHIAAVCNRAGWSMGKVKDTYIQYDEAGDQHVGRVVAGLPILSAKYACTPPYFCTTEVVATDGIGFVNSPNEAEEVTVVTTEEVDYGVKHLYATYAAEVISFRPVLIQCAAALIHTRAHYCSLMSEGSVLRSHPFFGLLFFSDPILAKLHQSVKVTHAWETCRYFPAHNLTGIPSHVIIFVEQEKLSHKLDVKFNEYATKMREDLDERQMGGHLTMDLIQKKITNPLLEEMNSVKAALANLRPVVNSSCRAVDTDGGTGTPFFTWNEDKNVGHLLPECFNINSICTPLQIWVM